MTSGGNEYFFWVVTALVGMSYGQFPDAEYCPVPCSRGQHTMCKYKPTGPNCATVKSFLNEEGRQKILGLHNSFRNSLASGELKVLPASSNMRQVYWDLELEAIAERWALQCNASFNDECRNVNRFSVGQIMSKSNILSTSVNYYEALLWKLWFAEMHNLNQAIIGNYRGEREVKHIAQILSGNTARIGCADVLYSTIQDPKPVRVTVCNYGPMITSNEQIYRIGKACTECPQRTECRGDFGKYPHLCAELRHFDVVEPEKSFDVVQREYDDEDIDNVVVESNIFRKGHKDDNPNHRHKHVNFPKQEPSKTDYVPGGRGLEEKDDKGSTSDDYEGEGIGMQASEGPAGSPAQAPAAGSAPATTKGANKETTKMPEQKPGDSKDAGTKEDASTATPTPTAKSRAEEETTTEEGGSFIKPANILNYLIVQGIIIWVTADF